MSDVVDLTVDEAVAAVERCKFIDEDEGRELVHCFLDSSFAAIGADWDASAVIDLIRCSDRRAFAEHPMWGVCLGVIGQGRLHWFDTVTPPEVAT